MAVVEYMFVVDDMGKRQIPGYIRDRGHWFNESDFTFIGWVKEGRDFWIPDTLVVLTKEQFVQRTLDMHAVRPMMKPNTDNSEAGLENQIQMTNEEVAAVAGQWYDNFTAENLAKDPETAV